MLQKKDIPGTSLNSQDPGELKVPELKRWLVCRALLRRARKSI